MNRRLYPSEAAANEQGRLLIAHLLREGVFGSWQPKSIQYDGPKRWLSQIEIDNGQDVSERTRLQQMWDDDEGRPVYYAYIGPIGQRCCIVHRDPVKAIRWAISRFKVKIQSLKWMYLELETPPPGGLDSYEM